MLDNEFLSKSAPSEESPRQSTKIRCGDDVFFNSSKRVMLFEPKVRVWPHRKMHFPETRQFRIRFLES